MKNIILFPLILIGAVAFAIQMVVPLYQEQAQIKKNNVVLEKEQKELQNDVLSLDQFIAQMRAHESEKTFLESFVPRDAREQDIINDISRIAESTHVNLFTLSFSDKVNNKGFRVDDGIKNLQYTQAGFTITGTYGDLRAFLAKVFRMKRLYALNGFSLEKIIVDPEADENVARDQMTLVGTFRFASLPKAAPLSIEALSSIDYRQISKIKNVVTQTQGITATVVPRKNPFAP